MSSTDNASSAVKLMEQIRVDNLVKFILIDVDSLNYMLIILDERIEICQMLFRVRSVYLYNYFLLWSFLETRHLKACLLFSGIITYLG